MLLPPSGATFHAFPNICILKLFNYLQKKGTLTKTELFVWLMVYFQGLSHYSDDDDDDDDGDDDDNDNYSLTYL